MRILYRGKTLSLPETETSATFEVQPGERLLVELKSGGHWYGHGFSHTQPYPLETGTIVNDCFAVNNIQNPIWMCSAGYALLAHTHGRLSVALNQNDDGLLSISPCDAPCILRVFRGRDLREVVMSLLAFLDWPNPIPEPGMFGDSIFCTWTQYPRCITQDRVMEMARQIRQHGYPCSLLILDDRWESCYGELEFSSDFPSPEQLISDLHALGFRVWLWVTPFVNKEARTFEELTAKRVLVPKRDGNGPALLKWWGGTAGVIDLSAPHARAWFKEQLVRLQRMGFDGFKIDGGDAKYLPPPEAAQWHAPIEASGYPDLLLDLFEDVAPTNCETRTAWLCQRRAILWREGGKNSHWGLDNGLKAMVTLALHLSVQGYDLLIPDMIPGRVRTLDADAPLPTDELMMRWTEATAFMPFMQFSYFPWNYAPPTEEAIRGYALLHKQLEPYLTEEAAKRAAQGPLLRPLWFDAPECRMLYTVGDEYQLGRDLLAAPVLDSGVYCRDVVLPPGEWRDARTGRVWHGPRILKAFPVPCPGIPVFVRAENRSLFEAARSVLARVVTGAVPAGITTTRYGAGITRSL